MYDNDYERFDEQFDHFFLDGKKKTKRHYKNRENVQNSEASNVYTYEQLLKRCQTLQSKVEKFVVPSPNILNGRKKKTVLTNFASICEVLDREKKHVGKYVLSELGADGNVNEFGELIIKKKSLKKENIEDVVRNYCKEYVTCKACDKHDSVMFRKKDRMLYVRCRVCQSERSVKDVDLGFRAMVGKRSNLNKL